MIMLFSKFETINNKTEHDKAEKTQDTETVTGDLVHILDTIVHM